MSEKKRKNFSGQFNAKVALEAIRGVKTTTEIAQEFVVHPTQVAQCIFRDVVSIYALFPGSNASIEWMSPMFPVKNNLTIINTLRQNQRPALPVS